MIDLDIEYLPYEDIAQVADQSLKEWGVENIPIPIEHIVEFQLNMDIIPIPGLQRAFDIEGFTSSDLSTIYVDEYIYQNRHLRYRYTLAHEVGHVVLHKDIFSRLSFNSSEEWINLIDQIDVRDYSRLETQGYIFGGVILVPPRHLTNLFQEKLPDVTPHIQEAKDKGIKRKGYLNYAKEELATLIAPSFDVSTDVIVKRLENSTLVKEIP